MLQRFLAISFILAMALADPIPKFDTQSDATKNLIDATEENVGKRLTRQVQDIRSFTYEFATAYLQRYIDVNYIVKCALNWIVSNATTIILGVIAAFGYCSITNKCSLHYETYIPASKLPTLITADSLDSAERFLLKALDAYQKR